MVFLPSESVFPQKVCRPGQSRDQSVQINKRRKISMWRSHRHAGAKHRVDHPCSDRNNSIRRSRNLKNQAASTPVDAPNANLPAEIRMPTVMDLDFSADMGRMNGRWQLSEKTQSSPVATAAAGLGQP
jgi:hypothetical protein